MKTLKPLPYKPGKKIIKLFIVILLFSISAASCKTSYDDITLGPPVKNSGGLTDFSHDNYGYIIYDLENSRIMKGHNADKAFNPASVTKIFTALYSLEKPGGDHQFSTKVSYNGKIKNGILHGDIFLTGAGDPEFSVEGILSLIAGLKKEKIKETTGRFYFDESLFNSDEMLDAEMPSEASYNPGISPLSFNSNIIYAMKKKDTDGKTELAGLFPALPSFSAYIYPEKPSYPFLKYTYSEGKETWGLPGKKPWENRQQLPVKHPGLYAAQSFQKLCSIHGIKIPSPEKGITDSSAKKISEFKSRPLSSIVKSMIYSSSNITAEMLYRVSSGLYHADTAENNRNKNKMEIFYRENFTGINWDNFTIKNASGLTSSNRVTPSQTAAVLLCLERGKTGLTIEDLLPLSGWEGTMRNRLNETESAFRVYSKTGSVFYSSALAGLFYGKSAKRYIFAIYINDNEKRRVYDSKKEKTEEDIRLGALWSKKASSSIDRFIEKMIEEL